MPQIVFAAFLFPTDFTDNTDFRPDRSEVIVTLISQMTQIFDLFGLKFRRFCFWEKVIFCSSLQYRSALVVARMRNIVYSTFDRITSGEVPIRVMAEIL